MARVEAYRKAEWRIEEARKAGATMLRLSSHGLTDAPEAIGKLTQLQSLYIGDNKFTSLPEAICKLTQLQSLHLSDNKLTSLPEAICKLTQLETLHLGDNKFTSLPEAICKLTQLKKLEIWRNKLTSLPEAIGGLRHLEILVINGNQLTDLPDALGDLSNLKELYLGRGVGGNPLVRLPKCIRRLTQLETLWANECQLSSLPDWLGELSALQTLVLHHNKLTDLPASLGHLSHLKELNLEQNPLNPDLAAAYAQDTDAVLRFLRARSEEEVVLNEAKLVLVGEGGVGKSSLLGALRGDDWEENRDTTHGVEIKAVHLTHADSGVKLTLNAWDFGGQPIYRPTHQLFFSAPAVYLVVWKPREGPEQGFVGYWTKTIKHRAYDPQRPDERPHVLVVATHGGPKERRAHIDEQALLDRFGELLVGFYHVDSAPPCDRLDELKEAIADTAASIPQVGRKVPGSWKRVIDAVKKRGEKDAYITYEQFERLCRRQKVGPELAATYVHILNELGHLIHYGDDEGLRDVVILKAEWLSKAMSFALEDSEVKERNGLVHHRRLGEIWSDPARPKRERYPPALHPIFLRLMERFDLSYRVVVPVDGGDAATSDTSLIAQLVPGGRPDGLADDWGAEPQAGDVERTQVCRIVDAGTGDAARAEGLMYRLIVRLHRYSMGRDDHRRSRHWQGGLLLDDDYNGRALLEQLGDDMRITVRAAYPERFLHLLSEEVKWLVEHFWKGLDCRIAVPCAPPCRGLFAIEALIDSRRQGRTEYPCSVCNKWVNIDSLLAKPPKMPEHDEALAALRQGQKDLARAIGTGFRSVRTGLRRLISQADEQFAGLMTALTHEARDAPRLFSLTPVDPGFWDKPKWISQKVRVTLWCEHSRLPVPALWDDPSRGVYEFEQPRAWLTKVAPYVRFAAGTLSLVLPVAGSAIKWSMDDAAYKRVAEDLDLSQKAFASLLGAGRAAGKYLAQDDDANLSDDATQMQQAETGDDQGRDGGPLDAPGGLLRAVQALVKDRDPGFGGLERVRNNRHEYLWIHPRFKKEYYPDPPVIPQRE